MDSIKFIQHSLNQVYERLQASCQGLTREQMLWRPAPGANHIGFILWHLGRANDSMMQRATKGSQVWEEEGWYKRFGYPQEGMGTGFGEEQIDALPLPQPEELLAYLTRVHQELLKRVQSMTPEHLDRPMDPAQPDRTVGMMLRHIITHSNNHHGQVDYIRGLEEQGWNLTPGLGMMQV